MVTGKRAVRESNFLETLRQVDEMDGELLARDAPEPFAAILRRMLIRHPPERRIPMTQVVEMLSG
jgi:hypothetical protein